MTTWKKRALGLLLVLALVLGLAACSQEAAEELTSAALDAALEALAQETTDPTLTAETARAAETTPESTEEEDLEEPEEAQEPATEEISTPEAPTAEEPPEELQTETTQASEPAAEAQPTSVEPEPATEAQPTPVEPEPAAEAQPAPVEPEPAEEILLPQDGSYTSREDVALYIHQYGTLPQNFITKKEAQALGWPGGSLEPYAPGKCIGGTYFGNYEGILPEAAGRSYTECDIDTLGASSRGAKRIVFSNDGLIYYTDDHYETFTLLYTAEGEVAP